MPIFLCHARPCVGHPRLSSPHLSKEDVDGLATRLGRVAKDHDGTLRHAFTLAMTLKAWARNDEVIRPYSLGQLHFTLSKEAMS